MKIKLAKLLQKAALCRVGTFFHVQHLCNGAVILAELCQQPRGDGEQVTACQGFYLPRVSEGGAHHHRAIAKLLVVVVNLGHTQHTLGRRREIQSQDALKAQTF